MDNKCIGQVLLDVVQRLNETPSICDKLCVDGHHVRFSKFGDIDVTFHGHQIEAPLAKFKLGVNIHPVQGNYIPEDLLYDDIVAQLMVLREEIA